MLTLTFSQTEALTVLALGSHADDIEIGCGGTILRLVEESQGLEVVWVVLSADGERAGEAQRSADAFMHGAASTRVILRTFRDGFLPYEGRAVKEFFETLKAEVSPDLIFTHYGFDLHQDHRLVSELTWNTFRDHLILEYEVPKDDGDRGAPNVFVHLREDVSRRKVEHIVGQFGSQKNRPWFTDDLFLAAMRLRGMESNSPTLYAEGFYCRKAVLDQPRTL